MASKIKDYFLLLKNAGSEFSNDNATKLSASLAYYTVFSIGPLLLVIVTLAGIFFSRENITGRIYTQIQSLLGQRGAQQVMEILQNIEHQNNKTLFGIIGVIVLVFGATTVFVEIQGSINYIWSIRAKPQKGWLKFLTNRLLSFSLIVGIGFLMIVSLFINTLMDLLTDNLQHFFGDANVILFKILNLAVLFCIITFLFAVVYKVLPDARIHWRDALVGASFTGVLFLIGKFLIGFYLGNSKTSNTYGAAASIIILLSWVYYSAMILYFGAEFTKVWALTKGKGIEAYDTAVFIVKREEKELPHRKLVPNQPQPTRSKS